MKVEVIRVEGLDIACQSVRLSFNSESAKQCKERQIGTIQGSPKGFDLWEDDVALMKKLIVAGDSHSKCMRMASVWLDITMPRYWYSEFDTYKVGTTAMSESSVHKMISRIKNDKLSMSDFEVEKDSFAWHNVENTLGDMIAGVEDYSISVESIKQMLPESFLQRRIVCTNYQTLRHIYFDRRNHRLPIWHKFLDELLVQLPFPEFITIEKEVTK